LIRMPAPTRRITSPMAELARRRRNMMLAKRGAELLEAGSAVFGTSGSSLEALKRAEELGCASVLDFPIAHHRFSRAILREEAELVPEFAATLQFDRFPSQVEQRFDAEIDAAGVVAVPSEFVRSSFEASGVPPEKLFTSPYGVDLRKFSQREERPSGPFRVLFVGQIGQRKGISYLLDAYQRFKKRDTELVLAGVLVGDPAPLSRRSSLFSHIPGLPHDEMPAVIQSADVLVLPSLVEGMALVVLEAMASGVPVIVSTNTGAADVVRDGVDGFVVPIRNAPAITEKLEYLYANMDARTEMGRQARLQAEKLTWDRYARSIAQLLEGRGLDRGPGVAPPPVAQSA
jgi:glycosyltransferase involved in cell wall biosynthesis